MVTVALLLRLAVLTKLPSTGPHHVPPPPRELTCQEEATCEEERDVVHLYDALVPAAIGAVKLYEWPRAGTLLKNCRQDPSGRWYPRVFEEDGVVGLSVLFNSDPQHLSFLRTVRAVFQIFADELLTSVAEDKRQELSNGIFWSPESTWHSVVAVFSENPSLLTEEEREAWQPVSPQQVEELGNALAGSLKAGPMPDITLKLHGLRLCADGSMIAVFVQSPTGSSQGFLSLRRRAKEVGTEVLGALNSRPKKLMHVTIGRILELPKNLTPSEAARLQDTIMRWAEAMGAGEWPPGTMNHSTWHRKLQMREEPEANARLTAAAELNGDPDIWEASEGIWGFLGSVGSGLTVQSAVLTRETGWWMTAYEVIREVHLDGQCVQCVGR